MCDFGSNHNHLNDPAHYGFLVDVPEIRALIRETERLTREIADTPSRLDALKPAFSTLLAATGWLPDLYAQPDTQSGMGGGIGQYALIAPPTGRCVSSRWSSRQDRRRRCTITSRGA